MKSFKILMILLYVLFGVLPTIFLFATHDMMCQYDMNPLCYLECASLAILELPLLFVDGKDF